MTKLSDIDPDLVVEIRCICDESGRTFDAVLNELVRAALSRRQGSRPYSIRPFDLGRPLFDLSSTSRALDYAEGEDHK